jgi:hypothetical protein
MLINATTIKVIISVSKLNSIYKAALEYSILFKSLRDI